jgi:hypothetical protein
VFSSHRRRLLGLVSATLLGAIALGGCTLLSPTKEEWTLHGSSPLGSISLGQLERETQDLSDCYAMGVAEACDRVGRQASDPATSRSMLFLKLRNAMSAYDVVTSSADPLERMLDLLTLIELQNIVWVDEGRIDQLPQVPATKDLRTALSRARENAWALAARALTTEQSEKVRQVILDWRRQNPEVQWVSFVRFSSGTDAGSSSLLSDIRSGLGGLINPFGSTTRSVDESREVAAKALFYAKRLPILLGWESEAAVGRIVDLPPLKRLEQDTSSVTRSVAELPWTLRTILQGVAAGIAALLLLAFALLLAYRRLSLGWEQKFRPASPQKPPTRVLPAP